jgi:hypothetical protein
MRCPTSPMKLFASVLAVHRSRLIDMYTSPALLDLSSAVAFILNPIWVSSKDNGRIV